MSVVVCGVFSASSYAEDALDRFSSVRLQAVHEAVERLQAQRIDVPLQGPLNQCRANMHVHSAFSHDSRGQIDDIVAAAKKVGTQVIMFTEHPADHYDFFVDGHQG
ncbi:MAG: PHP domain-containing protein, partial [Aureliella sp.]